MFKKGLFAAVLVMSSISVHAETNSVVDVTCRVAGGEIVNVTNTGALEYILDAGGNQITKLTLDNGAVVDFHGLSNEFQTLISDGIKQGVDVEACLSGDKLVEGMVRLSNKTL
ncbi:hypothetical protein ACOMICROBIO_NCLOACGD_05508 [Vibrio sp. B1ASS3]|uniref:hypothetical protein n=1 Tax=Vibrio sp. B1ASS3 TaxID=2751176 RepID=UPI001ABA0B4D|nr:hypothetical protein [Vibrio sp. B1ASS3]CAD7827865.1 hypothetical protein ACOMICROBIO_NCLOACGD_05508 [Vibrio sp. B1ASS3]CAE6966437.1 hypothetical protein ACOMICROBIO_NCLOACGD_05508 [Vibrio sp. B1ASS3]